MSIGELISLFVAVVGIMIGLFTYWGSVPVRELRYDILEESALITVDSFIDKRVQVLFDGAPVGTVFLWSVYVQNTGRTAIETKDYAVPLTIRFAPDTHVFSAEISTREPAIVPATLEQQETVFVLHPTALNAGQSVTVRMLVDSLSTRPTIEAMIVGGKPLRRMHGEGRSGWFAVGLLTFPLINSFIAPYLTMPWSALMALMAIIVWVGCCVRILVADQRRRQRRAAQRHPLKLI